MIVKHLIETYGSLQGVGLHRYLDHWLITAQSQEGTTECTDYGEPNPLVVVDHQSREVTTRSASQDHNIQIFTDASKVGWGAQRVHKSSVVSRGKKATQKCSRTEGGIPSPETVQEPVSK